MNFLDTSSRLSFESEEFHTATFSVDEFIQRKRHVVPLDVLRDDLGSHLKYLRFSLIELINQDYGQFVNLSSNLVGLDGRIQNIMGPLQRAQTDLQGLQDNLKSTFTTLQDEMKKVQDIRRGRDQLQCLRMAVCALETAEKYTVKLPVDIVTNSDFELLKSACEETAETQHLLIRCCCSPLKSSLEERLEHVRKKALSSLGTLLQIYCNVSSSSGPSNLILPEKTNTESIVVVRTLLQLYSELNCESFAETVFITSVLKPLCDTILTRKGNMSALLDEMESLMKICPVIVVSKDVVEYPWMVKFDFLSRGIFTQVSTILAKHFPHICSPANPDSFHQNWMRCENFISTVESAMPTQSHLVAFRESDSFKEFLSKWQFPVYFQLRFHTLAMELEPALSTISVPCPNPDFKLDVSRVVVHVVNQCWNKEKIFILHIAGRFLKASALFISRYVKALRTEIALNKDVQIPLLLSAYCDLTLSELVLRQILTTKLDELFNVLQPSSGSEVRNGSESGSSSSPTHDFLSGFEWDETRNCLQRRLIEITVNQTTSSISAVTEVPRLFRRTKRDVPTKCSDYVDSMLQSISSLKTQIMDFHLNDLWDSISVEIATQVIQMYLMQVQELLTSVQRMEESLKRLKKVKGQNSINQTSLDAGDQKALSDDDKIRLQIQIDVKHFSSQVRILCQGTNTSSIEKLVNDLNINM